MASKPQAGIPETSVWIYDGIQGERMDGDQVAQLREQYLHRMGWMWDCQSSIQFWDTWAFKMTTSRTPLLRTIVTPRLVRVQATGRQSLSLGQGNIAMPCRNET